MSREKFIRHYVYAISNLMEAQKQLKVCGLVLQKERICSTFSNRFFETQIGDINKIIKRLERQEVEE